MGKRGTEVAREAASLILLDDDFGSIVTTIRLGRRIYDNIRKAIGFILAVHVPIAGLALMPLVFGLPILFGPMHIAFLEMVIDPVCSLVFEAESEEETIMQRPPRPLDAPLISKQLIAWSLFQGVLAFFVVTTVFLVALKVGWTDDKVRALAFVALIMAIVALILVNRSLGASVLKAFKRVNSALIYVLMAVALMLFVTLYLPFVRSLFHFGILPFKDLVFGVTAGIITLLILEGIKYLLLRMAPNTSGIKE
jgi:Ca2+-transporting ATPase